MRRLAGAMVLCGLAACATMGGGGSGAPVVVDEGGEAQVGGFRLRLVSVQDSRCQPGTQCIREGEAVLTFRAAAGADDGTLRLKSTPADSAQSRYGAYFVRVDSVSPRPPAGGRYRAWLWMGRAR
jgi:hypothetical protein